METRFILVALRREDIDRSPEYHRKGDILPLLFSPFRLTPRIAECSALFYNIFRMKTTALMAFNNHIKTFLE
jgi:hypothetical protein